MRADCPAKRTPGRSGLNAPATPDVVNQSWLDNKTAGELSPAVFLFPRPKLSMGTRGVALGAPPCFRRFSAPTTPRVDRDPLSSGPMHFFFETHQPAHRLKGRPQVAPGEVASEPLHPGEPFHAP